MDLVKSLQLKGDVFFTCACSLKICSLTNDLLKQPVRHTGSFTAQLQLIWTSFWVLLQPLPPTWGEIRHHEPRPHTFSHTSHCSMVTFKQQALMFCNNFFKKYIINKIFFYFLFTHLFWIIYHSNNPQQKAVKPSTDF